MRPTRLKHKEIQKAQNPGKNSSVKYFQPKMLQFIDMCQNGMESYFSWESERNKSDSLNIFDKECSGFY